MSSDVPHSSRQLYEWMEEAMASLEFRHPPRELYEPFRYILRSGGKRIRPVMVLMACEVFGRDARTAMNQAIAIELFHNFTLIHDDIMDNAPLRRGNDSIFKKYGQTIAILSGDAMLVHAYRFLVKAPESQLVQLINTFNECAIRVCEGQQVDMNFETQSQVTSSEYIDMVGLKTASLLAASMKLGAIVSGAAGTDQDAIYRFGCELGISFQIKDDWLDVFGEASKVGKQPGGDIRQGKKTYLYLSALEKATGNQAARLKSAYGQSGTAEMEKVVQVFSELRMQESVLQDANIHFSLAMEYLSSIAVPESNKAQLRHLAESLLSREY